jgi:hypothetical protein
VVAIVLRTFLPASSFSGFGREGESNFAHTYTQIGLNRVSILGETVFDAHAKDFGI